MKKFVILVIFVCINSLFGQSTGSVKLYSLDDCLKIALRNNFDLQLNAPKLKAASAQLTAAFGAYLPSVNFNGGYSRQLNEKFQSVTIGNQTYGSSPNTYSMQAYATLPIFDGFSREANYSAAQLKLDGSYNSVIQTEQNVKILIYRQYLAIVQNQQIVKLRKDNIELGKKQLERMQAQHDAGVSPLSDVYAQEADLGNSEYNLVSSENDVSVAKANLLNTMGLHPDIRSEFLESSIQSVITEDEVTSFRQNIGSIEFSVNKGMQNRTDLAAYKSYVQSAESGVKAVSAGYYPRISAQGGWSFQNTEFSNFNDYGKSYIGLNFSLPIFENFNINNNVQQAKLNLSQQEIQLQQLENNIRSTIQTAYLNLDAAEKQIEISKRALRSAELNYESTKERFNVGTATVTELLTASNQLLNIQLTRVKSVYNYILCQKELLYSLGAI